MNIQEAIKSGKKFYRKAKPDTILAPGLPGTYHSLTTEDLLADDWVIVKDVTITRKRLLDAIVSAVTSAPIRYHYQNSSMAIRRSSVTTIEDIISSKEVIKNLLKELGLEEDA